MAQRYGVPPWTFEGTDDPVLAAWLARAAFFIRLEAEARTKVNDG